MNASKSCSLTVFTLLDLAHIPVTIMNSAPTGIWTQGTACYQLSYDLLTFSGCTTVKFDFSNTTLKKNKDKIEHFLMCLSSPTYSLPKQWVVTGNGIGQTSLTLKMTSKWQIITFLIQSEMWNSQIFNFIYLSVWLAISQF